MNIEAEGKSDQSATERALRVADRHTYIPLSDRRAVIIGISQYQDARLDLKYAARDAEEIYALLQTPSCGGFEKERIRFLTNKEATTAAVTEEALATYLAKGAPLGQEGEVREFLGSRGNRE